MKKRFVANNKGILSNKGYKDIMEGIAFVLWVVAVLGMLSVLYEVRGLQREVKELKVITNRKQRIIRKCLMHIRSELKYIQRSSQYIKERIYQNKKYNVYLWQKVVNCVKMCQTTIVCQNNFNKLTTYNKEKTFVKCINTK